MPWAIAPIIASFFGFGVLAWLFPCNPEQPRFWPKGLADDILYFFVSLLFYGAMTAGLTRLLVETGMGDKAPAAWKALESGYGLLPRLPLVLQCLVLLAVTDICQYWLHRVFHRRALWPFHAVHHSSEQVNWSTTYRIHPVNYLFYSASVAVLTRVMGFSPAAFAGVTMFNLVHSALVHANLNWSFGPFRYVLASPVFHRWHHSNDPAVRDKNFAPTFPVLDLMFGTFHMPRHALPADFGAEGVPDHFFAQMIYPFRAIAADLAGRSRARAPVRAPVDAEG
jgi:sterol desaturase/sphingolipid hydroxylase (fatty acid hydroxylase superfamily)